MTAQRRSRRPGSEIPRGVREGVLVRDGFQCQLCGAGIACGIYSLHHRQGRSGEAPHRFSNLLTLCGTGTTGCHGWVTVHPAQAFDLGLSVMRLGDLDTRLVPLVSGDQVWALDDYGQRIPLGTNPRLLSALEWASSGLVASMYPLILDAAPPCSDAADAGVPA